MKSHEVYENQSYDRYDGLPISGFEFVGTSTKPTKQEVLAGYETGYAKTFIMLIRPVTDLSHDPMIKWRIYRSKLTRSQLTQLNLQKKIKFLTRRVVRYAVPGLLCVLLVPFLLQRLPVGQVLLLGSLVLVLSYLYYLCGYEAGRSEQLIEFIQNIQE